jgi:hypothetical protein
LQWKNIFETFRHASFSFSLANSLKKREIFSFTLYLDLLGEVKNKNFASSIITELSCADLINISMRVCV